ncbi:MotA/TolQ/ExbB proton channel family protein [Paraburkholderia sp. Ac-20340]|uniref:MotA/TolQ/ExbB proton channel family protein n=1 Tax=Paraburkholderia sp. Ac-20340 TaxID=2703888 RepID=UPI00198146AB|nr:MotA/TolQ/ExbB proton channel family protein [Paraburkholderia sp. Ac-20340]MBN3855033.1 MotA/TolQ/ExbB proton channel family protein [Paraburkholderia sp. Ac-20340]
MATASIGIGALWAQSDIVIKCVAAGLLAMSIASWYVIVTRAFSQWRERARANRVARLFWLAPTLAEGAQAIGGDAQENAYVDLARTALDASAQHERATQAGRTPPALTDWLTRALHECIARRQTRVQSGLPLLATISSTAPFIGLFGTVWGIYHALMTIGATGQASIGEVAGPVGETLVMTAFGLAVAIPASLAYNALLRGNKTAIGTLSGFGFDVLDAIVAGERLDGQHEAIQHDAPRHATRLGARGLQAEAA